MSRNQGAAARLVQDRGALTLMDLDSIFAFNPS
jgi:hypothetical protein